MKRVSELLQMKINALGAVLWGWWAYQETLKAGRSKDEAWRLGDKPVVVDATNSCG